MIPTIPIPFTGTYPVTRAFGAKPADTPTAKKYQAWCIVGHDGIDFGLPMGIQVRSCGAGIVLQSGINGDYGISVTIKHRWGTSIYAHLSELRVHANQRVKKAHVIGLSGQSGYATGPHLHFGIRPNHPDILNGYQGYIDPQMYLPKRV